MLCLILAVLIGASVYSGADGGPSSWPDTLTGTLVGVLKVLVPLVLVLAGVVLIRGPSEVDIDLSDSGEDGDDEELGHSHSGAVRMFGVVLGSSDCGRDSGSDLRRSGSPSPPTATMPTPLAEACSEPLSGGMALLIPPPGWPCGPGQCRGLLHKPDVRLVAQTDGPDRGVAVCAIRTIVRVVVQWTFPGLAARPRSHLMAMGSLPRPPVRSSCSTRTQAWRHPRSRGRSRRSRPSRRSLQEIEVVVAGSGSETAIDPEQLKIGLGPAGEGSIWRLPPLKLLALSGKRLR